MKKQTQKKSLSRWLQAPVDPGSVQLAAVYGAGLLLIAAGLLTGKIGPIVRLGGWTSAVVVALIVIHAPLAFFASSSKSYPALSWLEKLDALILTVGFLGKLYGIAVVTSSVTSSSDPQAALAGLSSISQGISAALYSTMAGLAASAWTHCATLVVANRIAGEDA